MTIRTAYEDAMLSCTFQLMHNFDELKLVQCAIKTESRLMCGLLSSAILLCQLELLQYSEISGAYYSPLFHYSRAYLHYAEKNSFVNAYIVIPGIQTLNCKLLRRCYNNFLLFINQKNVSQTLIHLYRVFGARVELALYIGQYVTTYYIHVRLNITEWQKHIVLSMLGPAIYNIFLDKGKHMHA